MTKSFTWTRELQIATIALRDDKSPPRAHRDYNDRDLKSRAWEFSSVRPGHVLQGPQFEYFICLVQRVEPDYDTEAKTHRQFITALREAETYLLYHYLGKPSPATAEGEIVLRKANSPGPKYVTHFHNIQDGGYHIGHYFDDLAEAERDFANRVRRGL